MRAAAWASRMNRARLVGVFCERSSDLMATTSPTATRFTACTTPMPPVPMRRTTRYLPSSKSPTLSSLSSSSITPARPILLVLGAAGQRELLSGRTQAVGDGIGCLGEDVRAHGDDAFTR